MGFCKPNLYQISKQSNEVEFRNKKGPQRLKTKQTKNEIVTPIVILKLVDYPAKLLSKWLVRFYCSAWSSISCFRLISLCILAGSLITQEAVK